MKMGKKWQYGKVLFANIDDADDWANNRTLYRDLRKYYKNYVGFSSDKHYLDEGSLAELGLQDKLIIAGHGTEDGLVGFRNSPETLVRVLRRAGLKNVGIIKFHSCNIGVGDWLSRFRTSLSNSGVQFCYISGPESEGPSGYYSYTRFSRLFFSYTSGGYKILKGNVRRDFPGTRYVS